MNGIITPASMMRAKVFNARVLSSADASGVITIAAVADEAWALRKIVVSHDGSGTVDYDNLNSSVGISVQIGSDVRAFLVHPGNGGTSSLEFNDGPWVFDLDPGLYNGTKNEALIVTAEAFGTGIKSDTFILYQ
jgi:hypothetical protein